jgi:predicted  nucleic acid-binding Zn-ribbon protein
MTNSPAMNELLRRMGSVKRKIATRTASIDRLHTEIGRLELTVRFASEASERKAAQGKVDRRTKAIERLKDERYDLETSRSRISEAIAILVTQGHSTPEVLERGR